MDVLGSLRAALRATTFAVWTSGVVNAHRVAQRFDDDLRLPQGKRVFIRRWSEGVFPILGVDLALVHGEAPRELGPFVVVANHRSPLDILVAVHLFGGIILSHHGVARIPVVGDAARATDTIFVDRGDGKSGARAIRQMRTRLREGQNLIVFPEGTTFRGDAVRPFKRGAFTAAKGLEQVRVLPLGLAYRPGDEFVGETFGAHTLRVSRRRETPIWASIGAPRPVPRNAADEEELRGVVQGLVDLSAAHRDAR